MPGTEPGCTRQYAIEEVTPKKHGAQPTRCIGYAFLAKSPGASAKAVLCSSSHAREFSRAASVLYFLENVP